MDANEPASRLAPPIKKPSTFFTAIISAAFPEFTEPPYKNIQVISDFYFFSDYFGNH